MLQRIGTRLKQWFGPRRLELVEDLPTRVSVRSGPVLTVFDTQSERVIQNGKLIAMTPLISTVGVYHPANASLTIWAVNVHVKGGRFIELGHAYSKAEAMDIAGPISVLLKKPVDADR